MTIVYQDERIVVAVKPNGVLSTDEPGGMPSLLRQTLGTDCIRTVHRLDAQTGGLMVFARSRKAAALLSEQVRERQFSKGYLAVVQVHLHTGRTHQIRVQFASRGMPLWGDRKYGLPEEDASPLALWACQLSFTHPQTGKEMAFTSLPPEIEPWTQFARIKHI